MEFQVSQFVYFKYENNIQNIVNISIGQIVRRVSKIFLKDLVLLGL